MRGGAHRTGVRHGPGDRDAAASHARGWCGRPADRQRRRRQRDRAGCVAVATGVALLQSVVFVGNDDDISGAGNGGSPERHVLGVAVLAVGGGQVVALVELSQVLRTAVERGTAGSVDVIVPGGTPSRAVARIFNRPGDGDRRAVHPGGRGADAGYFQVRLKPGDDDRHRGRDAVRRVRHALAVVAVGNHEHVIRAGNETGRDPDGVTIGLLIAVAARQGPIPGLATVAGIIRGGRIESALLRQVDRVIPRPVGRVRAGVGDRPGNADVTVDIDRGTGRGRHLQIDVRCGKRDGHRDRVVLPGHLRHVIVGVRHEDQVHWAGGAVRNSDAGRLVVAASGLQGRQVAIDVLFDQSGGRARVQRRCAGQIHVVIPITVTVAGGKLGADVGHRPGNRKAVVQLGAAGGRGDVHLQLGGAH